MCPLKFLVAMAALSAATLCHAYTEEELQAFTKLENAILKAPMSKETAHTIESQHQASDDFASEAQQMARFWQEKLKPQHLERAIDIPKPTQNPKAAPTGVMVFVSLTMPDATLRALLKQSEQWQVPLVIRGVLPAGFPATARRIQSLLKTRQPDKPIQSGFAINPEWFRTFGITDVPSFVAVKPGRCLPKQACEESDYDLIKGNLSIPDALNQLTQGDNPDVVEEVLRRHQ
ncbi:type-F conjugative transfer system pilin assembly protein TrbC (plasmid) [Vibrio lentus]|nr:type-F conjugative transfer system pilin assembly protein TrbC [Vibrio lentus]PMI46401.1 type-F conjugative transfer system pilin assembly protein TrbC [Vibrio lentus]